MRFTARDYGRPRRPAPSTSCAWTRPATASRRCAPSRTSAAALGLKCEATASAPPLGQAANLQVALSIANGDFFEVPVPLGGLDVGVQEGLQLDEDGFVTAPDRTRPRSRARSGSARRAPHRPRLTPRAYRALVIPTTRVRIRIRPETRDLPTGPYREGEAAGEIHRITARLRSSGRPGGLRTPPRRCRAARSRRRWSRRRSRARAPGLRGHSPTGARSPSRSCPP